MMKNIKYITLFLSMIFISSLMSGCYNYKKTAPIAKNGVLDLRNWDFEKDGTVNLSGEWEFYWKKLLTSDDFKDNSQVFDGFINVPNAWNNFKVNGKEIKADGYATYRLTILLNKYNPIMALKIYEVSTAYTLFINGEKNLINGKVGTSFDDMIPKKRPITTFFNLNENKIEIIMNASNFVSKYGGFWYHSPYLGTYNQIKDKRDMDIIFQMFLFGCILIIGFFHLTLFLLRKEDLSSFYFCFFCLTICLRLLVTGKVYLLYNFIDMSSDNTARIQYLTAYISVPLFNLFFYSLFKKRYQKMILSFFISASILFALFAIIIPMKLKILPFLHSWFEIIIFINIIYMLYVIFLAALDKQDGIFIFIFGAFMLIISVVNDILYSNQIIRTLFLTPLGLLVFIITQSFLLSMRFSKAYKQLEDFSLNLEKIVKKRTRQLEKANREKTNFFINIAHETKTPLTLINNYLDQYIKKYGVNEEIKIIRENLDKIIRDIVDFLDLEKINKGKILYDHSQIINFSNILKNKVVMFCEAAKMKEINIDSKIGDDIYVKIDPNAIDRIINNLLDNAIKYNKKNGNIFINLKNNDDRVVLNIEDNGIGIDEEQLKNIFKPFYQVLHEKKNIQGIGIGLTIVKRIIDDLNGEIRVKSELDKGTTFTITLDKYILKESDIVQSKIDYSLPIIISRDEIKFDECIFDENTKSLLFVEDNLEMLSYLIDSTKDIYNVFYAVNGKEALEKLGMIPRPDIIISDIMMDIMDGYDFFNELYNMKEYQGIPFIFLTAKTTSDDKLKGLSRGAIDYITKPFNIEELLAKINTIIRNRKINKNLITEKNKKNILAEVKNKIEENISVNFDNNCIKYEITQREKEIIKLLMKGMLNKEICSQLYISYNTLRNHLSNIFRKCNAHNRIELFHILKKD